MDCGTKAPPFDSSNARHVAHLRHAEYFSGHDPNVLNEFGLINFLLVWHRILLYPSHQVVHQIKPTASEEAMKNHLSFLSVCVLLVSTLAGCNKDAATAPDGGAPNVSMSISSGSSLARGTAANSIEILSAKALLKNIAFHRFPSDNTVDVKAGPFVVTLDLSGTTNTIAASSIPAGQYDRVGFRLHKPEDIEPIPDPEFREGESGNQRYSVIVGGMYDGNPFVYKSRQNADQRVQLNPPLTVDDKGIANVTMTVTLHTWFIRNGQPLDPNDSRNAQAIDDNIRASFANIFKDNDRDGRPDF